MTSLATSPRLKEHHRREERKHIELEDREECYEMLSSGHDMTIVLMNSQPLCYLHKTCSRFQHELRGGAISLYSNEESINS